MKFKRCDGVYYDLGCMLAVRFSPNAHHTDGWRRATVLAAFVNAVFLWVAMGALIWEALNRLNELAVSDGFTLIAVAVIGVAINTLTVLLFMKVMT